MSHQCVSLLISLRFKLINPDCQSLKVSLLMSQQTASTQSSQLREQTSTSSLMCECVFFCLCVCVCSVPLFDCPGPLLLKVPADYFSTENNGSHSASPGHCSLPMYSLTPRSYSQTCTHTRTHLCVHVHTRG